MTRRGRGLGRSTGASIVSHFLQTVQIRLQNLDGAFVFWRVQRLDVVFHRKTHFEAVDVFSGIEERTQCLKEREGEEESHQYIHVRVVSNRQTV